MSIKLYAFIQVIDLGGGGVKRYWGPYNHNKETQELMLTEIMEFGGKWPNLLGEKKLTTLEAENKSLQMQIARLQGENDALATMLKDERRAVRDLQLRVVSLEAEIKDTLAENQGLAADLEMAREEIKKRKKEPKPVWD